MDEEESNEKTSIHLCGVFNFLGYNRQIRQHRVEAYREFNNLLNKNESKTIVTVGSKGEGLTKPFESDIDTLHLYKQVVCTEEEFTQVVPQDKTIFTFNPAYKYPGYNLLTLHKQGPHIPYEVSFSLKPSPRGQPLLSSDTLVKHVTEISRIQASSDVHFKGRAGPAASVTAGNKDHDIVISIPSVSPSIMTKWLFRPRQYDWPPQQLRERIARMRGNFVMKGYKGSEMESDEWRQCFNQAEILLIHSLEETLIKLYVLLKIILKELLRPLDKGKTVTSYVMKNIVFWLAEDNPTSSFQDKYLLKWLVRALRILQCSLEGEPFLPYYMIPERNVFGSNMTEKVRDNLVGAVKCLIREGPCLLMRLQKLDFTIDMDYDGLREFSDKQDDLEMLYLTWFNYSSSLEEQGLSPEDKLKNETYHGMILRQMEQVNSSWHPRLDDKLRYCENEMEKLTVILC